MPALPEKATIEDVLQEMSRIKDTVTEAVDEGVRSAMRAMPQWREAAEDAIDDAKHAMRDKPLQAMGVIFAAGVLAGWMVAWMGTRRG